MVRMVHDEVVLLNDADARRLLEGGPQAAYADAQDRRDQRLVRSVSADGEIHGGLQGAEMWRNSESFVNQDSNGGVQEITHIHRGRNVGSREKLDNPLENRGSNRLDQESSESQINDASDKSRSAVEGRSDIRREMGAFTERSRHSEDMAATELSPVMRLLAAINSPFGTLLHTDETTGATTKQKAQAGMVTGAFFLFGIVSCVGLVGYKVFGGSAHNEPTGQSAYTTPPASSVIARGSNSKKGSNASAGRTKSGSNASAVARHVSGTIEKGMDKVSSAKAKLAELSGHESEDGQLHAPKMNTSSSNKSGKIRRIESEKGRTDSYASGTDTDLFGHMVDSDR